MSIVCKLQVSGTPIQTSVGNFTNAIEEVISSKHISKYQNMLNHDFQQYIRNNMYRSGMENVQDLEKTFFVNIVGNSIVFGTTEPLIANKYEYGWEEDDDYDEDNYLMSTSPRYYIRPAINKIMNDLGERLSQDIYHDYSKESSNTGYSNYIITQESSYLNKYSGIL